uniref:Reverse transcriptase domain-containing protein n=1 Tax=Cannabis sativa TaxID=3483 RepID=A0A803NT24_CANSA
MSELRNSSILNHNSLKMRNVDLLWLKLGKYNKQRFGSLLKQVVDTQNEIDKLLNANALDVRMDEVKALELKLDDLMNREKLYWKQRSRSEWMIARDRNMKYFHNKASVKKKKNAITEIMTEFGQKLCLEEEIVGEVRVIVDYVTTPEYTFLINGRPKGRVILTRGLRQGCPLSPYLFLFCAESLSSLFSLEEARTELIRFRCYRSRSRVTHLFFADDSLVFGKANGGDSETIKCGSRWGYESFRVDISGYA